MRKIITTALAALLAAAVITALCACGASVDENAPDGMVAVDNGNMNFTMYVPQSWTVDMSTGTISAYARADDPANVSFTAFALEDRAATVETFWASYEKDFADTFGDGMEYVDENGEASDTPAPSKTTLGGLEAYKYVYRAVVTGSTYRFMQVVCLQAGTVYLLTYTATDDGYDTYAADVNDIVNNFKFN